MAAQVMNANVQRKVMGEDRDGAASLPDRRSRTPVSVLERLASRDGRAGSTFQPTDTQLRNTRRFLGLSLPTFTVRPGECKHGGRTVRADECSLTDRPTVVMLDVKGGQSGSVQSVLRQLPQKGHRRCPLCQAGDTASDSEEVEVEYKWDTDRPSMFFASVGEARLGGTYDVANTVQHSHVVNVFGDNYALCGVIYRTRCGGASQFTCQVYLEEGWWTYTDLQGGVVEHVGDRFDDDYLQGKESMLMYVRVDLVVTRYGRDVVTWKRAAPRAVDGKVRRACVRIA